MSFFKFKVKSKDFGYLVMHINGPFVHFKIQKKTLMKFDIREMVGLELNQGDSLYLVISLSKAGDSINCHSITLILNDIVDRDAVYFYLAIWKSYLNDIYSHQVGALA